MLRLVKWTLLACLVTATAALATGVVTVAQRLPDGSIELRPRVDGQAVRWYASKALDVLPEPRARSLRESARSVVAAVR
jgi:hypothetical protein